MAQPRVTTSIQWRSPLLAVLSYGFRPFFLLGAAYAAIAIPLWLVMLALGVAPAGPFQGMRWHAHEMIFGYLAAIIAGFALTAVPNWTGRLPLSGLPLAGLVGLWLAGRFASSFIASVTWAAVIDVTFLFALAAAIWREILAGKNARNVPIALLITIFALANLQFHLEGLWPELQGYGQRLALGVTTLLIALIGGRITPSFTHNWMARMGLEPRPEAQTGACATGSSRGLLDRPTNGVAVRLGPVGSKHRAPRASFALARHVDGTRAHLTCAPHRLSLACGFSRASRRLSTKPFLLGSFDCIACANCRGDRNHDSGGHDAGEPRSHRPGD
jgi:hypothetical protein